METHQPEYPEDSRASRISIYLKREADPDLVVERLREIALSFGYAVRIGRTAGQGNIGELLTAIAYGELLVVEPPDDSERNP